MRVTATAATTVAVVSVERLECGMVLPGERQRTRPSADDTTPGAGAGSLRHRVDCVLPSSLRAALGQREHDHRTAGVAHVGVVVEGADRAESGGRILRTNVERYASPRPAADAREHGDVLLTVRREVGHRVPDDARRRLELP